MLSVLLNAVLGLSLLSAAVWVWVNFAGGRGRTLNYRLDPEAPADAPPGASEGGGWPRVAVVAPGRDEAEHLPRVLPELCGQDYDAGRHRVVFVDDASTDATPGIVAEMTPRFGHLLAVRNDDDPPAGWVGKCWAVHRGVAELGVLEEEAGDAAGWLCFTDADLEWDPRLLRCAMAYALEHEADLLGVIPTLKFGSVSEAVVQLQLALALGCLLPFETAMDPETPWTMTGGAFILVRRSFYDEIGGHAAVKGQVVEDLKLGMALKAAGARHRVALAGDLQGCRMYDGWADMWEGLTKNAYAGMEHRWWVALGVVAAVWGLNVLTPVYLLGAAVWLAVAPGWRPGLALAGAVAALLLQARALNTVCRMMKLSPRYAWTMAAGGAAYSAIIVASAWRYYRGGNLWKGRRYGAAG